MFVVLVALSLAVAAYQPALAGNGGAPVYAADSATAISGQYIIVFKAGSGPAHRAAAMESARGNGAEVLYVYDAALNGFAAKLPAQALNGLVHNPNVEYIEADQGVGGHDPKPCHLGARSD
jgi:hypothetical protein